jgi:Bacteriocin-protection, YdeI or OmpD-Associated
MIKPISGGVAHDLPADLRKVLSSDPKALAAWEDLTPLARNEWICWAISVKKPETRREHVERVCPELKEGIRRPCCWMGCTHRTDKSLSPSQKFILGKRSKKKSGAPERRHKKSERTSGEARDRGGLGTVSDLSDTLRPGRI